MKKIMLPLILTYLAVAASVNTSFAQQSKETSKAELDVTKTEEVQLRVKKAYLKKEIQNQKRLDSRPAKTRAKMKAEPAHHVLKKSEIE